MGEELVIAKDELFYTGTPEQIWQKYCGFLDLSLEEFMQIQEHLLMEEIELVADSPLGKKIMGGNKPKSVEEFRRTVPLTTYDDYAPYIGNCQEDVLAEKPYCWMRTSGLTGNPKWAPYTRSGFDRATTDSMAAFILSAAQKKGEVYLNRKSTPLLILPPRPYLTGWITFGVVNRLDRQPIIPLEIAEKMEFFHKIEENFRVALRSKVDFICALSSVLAKVGERFTSESRSLKLSWQLLHPLVIYHLARAQLRSKIKKRPLLPQDIWAIKGIVCGGMDYSFYKEQVQRYWGTIPLDTYMTTETGFIAMPSWTKKDKTFAPYSVFIELIPEEEWLKNKEDKEFQPTTVLLNEVEPGKRYEVVATNFHGMPFLRYRIGDLIKITSLEDKETDIRIPQMEFVSRADDIIDIAGFTRLNEKTIWQAIANTGISYEDWVIRKEYLAEQPILHLYIELKENKDAQTVEKLVHNQLKTLDHDYHDLEAMLDMRPLKVTLLTSGTFQRYLEGKQKEGAELAHLKPPHMNPSDSIVAELIKMS